MGPTVQGAHIHRELPLLQNADAALNFVARATARAQATPSAHATPKTRHRTIGATCKAFFTGAFGVLEDFPEGEGGGACLYFCSSTRPPPPQTPQKKGHTVLCRRRPTSHAALSDAVQFSATDL